MALLSVADIRMPDAGPDESDGLLVYLRALARVAHAPAASHWCTPGHNRGRALDDEPVRPAMVVPLVLADREEAR